MMLRVSLMLLGLPALLSAQTIVNSTGLHVGVAASRAGTPGLTVGIDQAFSLGHRVLFRVDARAASFPHHGNNNPSAPGSTMDVRGGEDPTVQGVVGAGVIVFPGAARSGLYLTALAGPQWISYPGQATQLGFALQAGVGKTIPLSQTVATFEVRWIHRIDAGRSPWFTIPVTVGIRLP